MLKNKNVSEQRLLASRCFIEKQKPKIINAKTTPKPKPKDPPKHRRVFTFRPIRTNIKNMPKPIQSILNSGSDCVIVETECQLSNGLPVITIVGLGTKAIDESRERVRAAFASSQIAMPRKRITINLAPADIPKDSTGLDLAIALSIMQADGQIKTPLDEGTIVIGELGLDGSVRAIRGIIGKLLAGQKRGISRFLIPEANLAQAQLIPNLTLTPVKTLGEIVGSLSHGKPLQKIETGSGSPLPKNTPEQHYELSEIVGQQRAKRGLEIAAAGGHNILLSGSPGTGKSMLAKALPSLLPPLQRQEILEVTQVHSLVNGNYDELVTLRPFRAPHHSSSHVSIIGGGNNLRPGEISLAHRGVLFLDEFPEFGRSTIEALRQPLEDRTVTVARAKETAVFPANFIMIATANPCPCGFYGTSKPCTCPAHAINRYRQKLSGPIMDRIDLYTDVHEVDHDKLLSPAKNNEDTSIQKRIQKARAIQLDRYGTPTKLNAYMSNADIKSKGNLNQDAQNILNQAAKSLDLSARSYMRIIKVARTIADLSSSSEITSEHIAEALQYRTQQTLNTHL